MVITARKRSLGQSNTFTGARQSFCRGALYDVTSCLTAWSHVPSGGLYPVGMGVSVEGEGGGSTHPTGMLSCLTVNRVPQGHGII